MLPELLASSLFPTLLTVLGHVLRRRFKAENRLLE
jgi:hypothetical protein